MHIWGITTEQASEAMYNANEHYPGLIFNRAPEKYGAGIRFTLKMTDMDAYGAADTAYWNDGRGSGRRGSYASWDAHGAFMAEVFNLNPEARIKTAACDLRGVEAFLAHYPEGAYYLPQTVVG